MSGHSKWATIKRKKGKTDAARAKVFSKLIKEITIAARMGGGDESANPRLRTAILTGKAANMPNVNIEKAIQKGTGDLDGVNYEEITYEAYGPGGTAFLLDILTDNRNRCVSEIRHLLGKNGGTLAEGGSVAWMFNRAGLILVPVEGVDEDELMEVVLEAGAEDLATEGEFYSITTPVDDFWEIRATVEETGYPIESAEVAMIPSTLVSVEGSTAKQVFRLMDILDDHDDIQKFWTNADLPDDMEDED